MPAFVHEAPLRLAYSAPARMIAAVAFELALGSPFGNVVLPLPTKRGSL